jgi:hypothetical protein
LRRHHSRLDEPHSSNEVRINPRRKQSHVLDSHIFTSIRSFAWRSAAFTCEWTIRLLSGAKLRFLGIVVNSSGKTKPAWVTGGLKNPMIARVC